MATRGCSLQHPRHGEVEHERARVCVQDLAFNYLVRCSKPKSHFIFDKDGNIFLLNQQISDIKN